MKFPVILSLVLFANAAVAQIDVNQILNTVGGSSNLTNDKIVKGLKEALSIGTNNSSDKAAKLDGFYKNPKIKIPFPKEAQQMEKTLRSIGMDAEVDRFVKSLNRAAEDASKKAAPIFLKAITSMSITDGMKILKGGNSAATDYLKSSTTGQLKTEFKPVVKSSLQKVEVTKYWKPLVKNYNKVPMVKKMNPDLDDYVTTKAIDGLFKLIADEELKIRKDPEARITQLLKDVFGNK